MLKLKNGNDNNVVMDSSLPEDVVVGIGTGAMDSNSPNMGTFDDDDNDDVHCCHPAGPSFWLQTLELNILMPALPCKRR